MSVSSRNSVAVNECWGMSCLERTLSMSVESLGSGDRDTAGIVAKKLGVREIEASLKLVWFVAFASNCKIDVIVFCFPSPNLLETLWETMLTLL